RFSRDWSSDVCSSDLGGPLHPAECSASVSATRRPSGPGFPRPITTSSSLSLARNSGFWAPCSCCCCLSSSRSLLCASFEATPISSEEHTFELQLRENI